MVHSSAVILSALALGVAPSLCASIPREYILQRRELLTRPQGPAPSLGSVPGAPAANFAPLLTRRELGDELVLEARETSQQHHREDVHKFNVRKSEHNHRVHLEDVMKHHKHQAANHHKRDDESQLFARAQGSFPPGQIPPNSLSGALPTRDVEDLFTRAEGPPPAPNSAAPPTRRELGDEFVLEARETSKQRHREDVHKFDVRKSEHRHHVHLENVMKYHKHQAANHHKRDDESQLFARDSDDEDKDKRRRHRHHHHHGEEKGDDHDESRHSSRGLLFGGDVELD